MMGYYVYKFHNQYNDLLYIGKTNNLTQRIQSHKNNKKWWNEVDKIEYTECKNKTDMDLYEIYYINKLNPRYNISTSNGVSASFILDDLKFIKYEEQIYNGTIKSNEQTDFDKVDRYGRNIKDNSVQQLFKYRDAINKKDILEFSRYNWFLDYSWYELLKDKTFIWNDENPFVFNFEKFNSSECIDRGEIWYTSILYLDKGSIKLYDFLSNIQNNSIKPLKIITRSLLKKLNENSKVKYELIDNSKEYGFNIHIL
jgi:hypothetical protein